MDYPAHKTAQRNHTRHAWFHLSASTGKEKDEETGYGYFGARYMDHELMTMWLSVDPMMDKYPNISQYAYCAWNPVKMIDPDGRAVIPTNTLMSNPEASSFLYIAEHNSVFRYVLKRYYTNQSNLYIHLAQTKRDDGTPTGPYVLAQTQPASEISNPVGKYGLERIIINSDILDEKGNMKGDPTFIFNALLHECIHAKLFDIRQSDKDYENYPGYRDFIIDRTCDGGQHNYMGAVIRGTLIAGMKEFDKQVGLSHSEEWYEAISWAGLQSSAAWRDFKEANPELAQRYIRIQNNEVQSIKD